jgi:hypothetical protein
MSKQSFHFACISEFTNIFKIKYAHNKKELALEIIPICEAKEI